METIIRIESLEKKYPVESREIFNVKKQYVHAVDGINLDIYKGENIGIVGESGCGKTTLARLILRLIDPTSGKIFFNDQEITSLSKKEMKKYRTKMQMIFQDPYSSLDPQKSVLNILAEPLKIHKRYRDNPIVDQVKNALELVDLPNNKEFLDNLPDELSGGQRQRLGIARALILGAELIVADEPVSMLDASVKAAITSLLMELKNRKKLTYIFITHEIPVAYHLCDRIAVMYLGKIVEIGKTKDVVKNALHPYTQLLVEAIPPLRPNDKWAENIIERGDISSFVEPYFKCQFYDRCPISQAKCNEGTPVLVEMEKDHFVACNGIRD